MKEQTKERIIKGMKTYRHKQNPQEKIFHDKFIEKFEHGVLMDQIVMPIDRHGEPCAYLTDQQKEIMITTIQWLGSPVGQSFLRDCGFEKK